MKKIEWSRQRLYGDVNASDYRVEYKPTERVAFECVIARQVFRLTHDEAEDLVKALNFFVGKAPAGQRSGE